MAARHKMRRAQDGARAALGNLSVKSESRGNMITAAAIELFGDDVDKDLSFITKFGWPVSLTGLAHLVMQIIDFAVIGHMLSAEALAAVGLCHVVLNLTHEPATFIVANAMTAQSVGAIGQSSAQLFAYLRAAVLFSCALAVPISALLFATPSVLELLFSLPDEVVDGVRVYAPLCALHIVPSLLLAAQVGYLRAQGKLRTTCLVYLSMVAPNVVLSQHLVGLQGIGGSAVATALTRVLAVALLAACHRDAFRSVSSSSHHSRGDPESEGDGLTPLQALQHYYLHSLLPATLRVGVGPLLVVVALALGGGAVDAAATLAVASLLLSASVVACAGVQQATLMLTSRKIGLPHAARHVLRLSATLLLLCAALVRATRPAHAYTLARSWARVPRLEHPRRCAADRAPSNGKLTSA